MLVLAVGVPGVGALVRERTEADLAACAALARAVHERDGYPHYLPGPATAGPLTRRKPAEPLTGRLSRRVRCARIGRVIGTFLPE